MNKEILAGNLRQLRGEIRSRWGDLTDDDFDRAQGSLEKLAGILETRYGVAKDQVKLELQKLSTRLGEMSGGAKQPPMKPPAEKLSGAKHEGMHRELEPEEVGRK